MIEKIKKALEEDPTYLVVVPTIQDGVAIRNKGIPENRIAVLASLRGHTKYLVMSSDQFQNLLLEEKCLRLKSENQNSKEKPTLQ